MKCLVCGTELNQATACPVCGEKVVSVVGNMPEELKQKFVNTAREKRRSALGNISVFLRCYYWKDENGTLVERAREDVMIGQNFGEMEPEQVRWMETEYARQAVGEALTITAIIVDEAGNKREHMVKVIAPKTDTRWKVGCVLKPGFNVAIRVGNETTYADSKEINLKG